MKNSPPLMLLLACLLFTGSTWAEKADRDKPMNIEADALRYDDVKQVSIFSGNVVLSKGSITIRGERLEARQDPDGFQFGLVTGSAAKPAFFRQKREGLEEFIEGQADLIEYDGRKDTVRFTRNAQLRRLRGTTLADEVNGAVIIYENLTDTFTVEGGTGAGGSGRVRAMLTPKSSAPGAGTSAAPATPSGARPAGAGN